MSIFFKVKFVISDPYVIQSSNVLLNLLFLAFRQILTLLQNIVHNGSGGMHTPQSICTYIKIKRLTGVLSDTLILRELGGLERCQW